MRVGFIIVCYKTGNEMIKSLKKEIFDMNFKDPRLYFIDNTKNNHGYAYGVNKGIRKAMKKGLDVFAICNPDISFQKLRGKDILEAGKYFDIWGLAMKQDGKIYYGGEIDRWRMSGGLISKKPKKRFVKVDFITGSLMFIKKQVINELGFFDENYFMYYEDVDYCQRARKAGFKIGIDTSLVYKHFEQSKNFKKKDYYLTRNRLRFLLRFGSLKQKIYELVRLPKTAWEAFGQRSAT